MDLLPSPTSESLYGPAPYVGRPDRRWDGGQFTHYACRAGMLRHVPSLFRRCSCLDSYILDREGLPQDQTEEFLQTWLFFGLLAEFYGYNDEPDDATHRHVRVLASDREAAIQSLYDTFVREGVVTGARLLSPGEADRLIERTISSKDPTMIVKRVNYLHDCLRFTQELLITQGSEEADLRSSVFISTAALGECLASALNHFRRLKDLGLTTIWRMALWEPGPNFPRAHGHVKMQMLRSHWCTSDIERTGHVYAGLATRYFISHMNKPRTDRTHDACTTQRCVAAQINNSTYQLKHANGCDGCDRIGIDEKKVKRILRKIDGTGAFPILRLKVSGKTGDVTSIRVEKWRPGKPYIALSHVWADGLGNPEANQLQSCQVNLIAKLLRGFPDPLVNRGPNFRGSNYISHWFWIDTLCVPVTLNEKRLALNRIAAVYRQATHVLVLDKSIFAYNSENETPAATAQTCLRILASATWMRRLWTLQEGILAKSLYFQFKNRLVDLHSALESLHQWSLRDIRYRCLWWDVNNEVDGLRALALNIQTTIIREGSTLNNWLFNLQLALYFRSVSVAADEPLCLTTLLGIEQSLVGRERCRQKRMTIVLRKLAERFGGIPSSIIFAVDEPITLASLPGWRWAPKSLLLSTERPVQKFSRIMSRWKSSELGMVTEDGLLVSYRGMRITLNPWVKGTQIWPWSLYHCIMTDTTLMSQSRPLCRDKVTGQWFLITDSFERDRIGNSSAEDSGRRDTWPVGHGANQRKLDEGLVHPIFSELCRGNQALIIAEEEERRRCLLVRLRGEQSERVPLHVHGSFTVDLIKLPDSLTSALDFLRDIAKEVSLSEENEALLKLGDRIADGVDIHGDECQSILQALMHKMRDMTTAAWDADPDGPIMRGVKDMIREGARDTCWVLLPSMVGYDLSIEPMAGGEKIQWIVDRPVAGSGVCTEECCQDDSTAG